MCMLGFGGAKTERSLVGVEFKFLICAGKFSKGSIRLVSFRIIESPYRHSHVACESLRETEIAHSRCLLTIVLSCFLLET